MIQKTEFEYFLNLSMPSMRLILKCYFPLIFSFSLSLKTQKLSNLSQTLSQSNWTIANVNTKFIIIVTMSKSECFLTLSE